MPLPSISSPKRRHALARTSGSVSLPGDQLEQLHVADGVEEVRDEEALLEARRRGPASIPLMGRPEVFELTIVSGSRCGSSLANSACLTARSSFTTSITQSHSAMRARSSSKLPISISVERRGGEERGGLLLLQVGQRAERRTCCGRPCFASSPGRLGRDDVEEERRGCRRWPGARRCRCPSRRRRAPRPFG